MAKNDEDKRHLTPEGIVLNENLFKKGEYKGDFRYRLEIAVDEDSEDLERFEQELIDFAMAESGMSEDDIWDMIEDGEFHLPIVDGDKKAKQRERQGKDGSATKGKMIIKPMDTIYNKHGDDDDGGIEVFDEGGDDLLAKDVYRGCYGVAVVTFGYYEGKNTGVKLYLKSFCKTKDGERLGGAGSNKDLFAGSRKSGKTRRRK